MRLLLFSFLLITSLFASEHQFREIWAYVMTGEEGHIQTSMPVTDIGLFCARLDEEGKLPKIPNRLLLNKKVQKDVRVHCVIAAPYNLSLMYWCLNKDLETRNTLVRRIVEISKDFDGVQIDFESIRSKERGAYVEFLRAIKKSLPPEKILSVALPARTRVLQDGYDYDQIGKIADRVLIMAYDEHWGAGSPGTIASLDWCKKVTSFAESQVEPDKLIIGLPLYGRVWQVQKVSKALKYFQTLELWKEKNQSVVKREADGTPYFEFKESVDAVVYFEDMQSLKTKLNWYEKTSVRGVGFWRIGQEPAALWKTLSMPGM